jgi:hypothetical protein
MPTYTFSRTLDQVRSLVLRKIRYLGRGRTASADDAAIVDEAMDLRLKELHALGVLWWNVSPAVTDLALTASVATKSLSAVTDYLFPVSAALRISGDDIPLEIISHRQYQAIPNKADTGEPEQVHISGGTAYFYPTPDDTYTVKLTYQAIAADTASPDQPDVPVAMLRSFVTLVAADCADDFGVPEQRVMRLKAEAKDAERTLRILNTERVTSTPVEVDYF